MSFLLPVLPDPALRQPATLAAITPIILSVYAQAVLAILPNTFILKLALLPFIVWQTWSCVVGLDFSAAVAKWSGLQSDDRLRFWNVSFATAMLNMALRSFEWTFLIKTPLRKHEWAEGRVPPVERPLSIGTVLLDASDLFFNLRGLGWSWSSRPFPRQSTPPPSIASVFVKTLLTFTVLDIAHYILHLMNPTIDKTGGGSLFDATIPFLPGAVSIAIATFVGGVWVYAQIDSMYQVATLVGRILLRQPASHWPLFFRRPWMATSVRDFWSVRWHQMFRHFFVVFGARPGGTLLGQPGAVMGAFSLSGFMHIVAMWGIGREIEIRHDAGFFVLMGVGAILESEFQRATGLPVRGWFGWLWTMAWTILWGSLLIDSWARRGLFAVDFFPDHLRPGKLLIDGSISLFSM